MFQRAAQWVGKVYYSQDQSDAASDGDGHYYRPDCSGFVSMAWHLPKKSDGWDLNTGDFGSWAGKTWLASLDDLEPGDAILGVSYGHIALFDHWDNSAHTSATVYEEYQTGYTAAHHSVSRSFYDNSGFRGIRYNNKISSQDPDNAPATIVNPSDHSMQIYARGTDGTLRQWFHDSAGWHLNISLGGSITGQPATVVNPSDNSMQIYARGTDGTLRQWYHDASGWHLNINLGGSIACDPATIINPSDNSMQIYARGTDGTLRQWFHDASGWHLNINLGGSITGQPATIINPSDNSMQIYARGTDNTLRQWFHDSGGWHLNIGLGSSIASDPATIINPSDNSMQIYAKGTDNTLRQWFHDSAGWHLNISLGGSI
jgi:hypothetical protein